MESRPVGHVCEHGIAIDQGPCLRSVRITHGKQPSEAVLELTMLEVERALDEGRRPLDEWLERVHAYEALKEPRGA